ncbi:hypothetical protein R5R35_012235 [Gryllus longicercus]|uniref:Uncharacterized protein n=1 Tax=Gryllus longicercus TaxID=2509291 RepID=A0AAN9Z583_9ORTH
MSSQLTGPGARPSPPPPPCRLGAPVQQTLAERRGRFLRRWGVDHHTHHPPLAQDAVTLRGAEDMGQ